MSETRRRDRAAEKALGQGIHARPFRHEIPDGCQSSRQARIPSGDRPKSKSAKKRLKSGISLGTDVL